MKAESSIIRLLTITIFLTLAEKPAIAGRLGIFEDLVKEVVRTPAAITRELSPKHKPNSRDITITRIRPVIGTHTGMVLIANSNPTQIFYQASNNGTHWTNLSLLPNTNSTLKNTTFIRVSTNQQYNQPPVTNTYSVTVGKRYGFQWGTTAWILVEITPR